MDLLYPRKSAVRNIVGILLSSGCMEKKRLGRPASEKPLGRALAVRFTSEEEELVRAAAGDGAVATFIREAAVAAARKASSARR